MDLSIIDKINENASIYPEVAEAKKILSENGIDFENRTVDVEKLAAYHQASKQGSVDMPDKQTMITKVFAALILFPQKEANGEINYLFGKGIGVEIALLGNCPGREASNAEFEPRSHSDFEIYDVKDDSVFDKYPGFHRVFGGQEYYPEDQTKGLKQIPAGYLDQTHQVVDFYGIEVLVPALEVLYVDKMLKKESTPRPEGYDAELLAKKYKLNPELCKKLYVDHRGKIEKERIKASVPDFETLIGKINAFVKDAIENNRAQINSFNNFVKTCPFASGYQGIPFGAVVPLEGGDIANKQVTPAYIEKVEEKYNSYVQEKIDKLEKELAEVVETVEQTNETTTTWTAE